MKPLALLLALSYFLVSAPLVDAQDGDRVRSVSVYECSHSASDQPDRSNPRTLLSLAACLGDPDPAIRDRLAYSTLADMLRNEMPEPINLLALKVYLTAVVKAQPRRNEGFAAPFAMLVLSEVARTDRVEPWMSPEERTELITLGADYLAGLTDYRGFDDEEGWRHGVAHTADLFMQFALNDAITMEDAGLIVEAVSGKVAAPDAPAYVFGEPERLARPILFLARAGLRTDEQWVAFFNALKPDEEAPRWQDPYMSEDGLAAIHNTKAFAMALYVNASVSEAPELAPILSGSLELLNALP